MMSLLFLSLLFAAANCLRSPFDSQSRRDLLRMPTSLFDPFPSSIDPFRPTNFFPSDDICTKIPNIPGLRFPPNSKIPKTRLMDKSFHSEIDHSTFACKDRKNDWFYVLISTLNIDSPEFLNNQNTAYYYKADKKTLISRESINVDFKQMWKSILGASGRRSSNSIFDSQDSIFDSDDIFPRIQAPIISPIVIPNELQHNTNALQTLIETDKCKPEKVDGLDYPTLNTSDLTNAAVSEPKHESFLCKESDEASYLLRTTITAKSAGVTLKRYNIVKYPLNEKSEPDKTRVQYEKGQSSSYGSASGSSSSSSFNKLY